MLSLTRRIDYALVAVAFLAQRQSGAMGPASARQIGDQFGLPLPLLMNLLKDLTHAGILTSSRGSRGGYMLAKRPDEVTLIQIIHAVEGPLRLVPCADQIESESQSCTLAQQCPIREPLRRLHERILGFFEQMTLADLIEQEVDVPLGHVGV